MAKLPTSIILIYIFFSLFILALIIWNIVSFFKLNSEDINQGIQNVFCLRLICKNSEGLADQTVPIQPIKVDSKHFETLNYCTANAPPGQFQELVKSCSVDPTIMTEYDRELFVNFLDWYPNNYTKTCGNSWIISAEPGSNQRALRNNDEYGNLDANLICWTVACAENLNLTTNAGYIDLKNECQQISNP